MTEFISWYPSCTIEKYSAGQVKWARAHFSGYLSGDALRGAFLGHAEDGIVRDEGNHLVAGGISNLALLFTGQGGHPLAEGRAAFGVGAEASEFSSEHVHLSPERGEALGQTFYRPMDGGYPYLSAPGVVEGQVTFTETEACFEWHEWCWATGPVKPEPHHSLHAAYGTYEHAMLNRKASEAGYGSKEPGVAWVFRTAVALR